MSNFGDGNFGDDTFGGAVTTRWKYDQVTADMLVPYNPLPRGDSGYATYEWQVKVQHDASPRGFAYLYQFSIHGPGPAPCNGYLQVQTNGTDLGNAADCHNINFSIWCYPSAAIPGVGLYEDIRPTYHGMSDDMEMDGAGAQIMQFFDWQEGETITLRLENDGLGGVTAKYKGDMHGNVWVTVGTIRGVGSGYGQDHTPWQYFGAYTAFCAEFYAPVYGDTTTTEDFIDHMQVELSHLLADGQALLNQLDYRHGYSDPDDGVLCTLTETGDLAHRVINMDYDGGQNDPRGRYLHLLSLAGAETHFTLPALGTTPFTGYTLTRAPSGGTLKRTDTGAAIQLNTPVDTAEWTYVPAAGTTIDEFYWTVTNALRTSLHDRVVLSLGRPTARSATVETPHNTVVDVTLNATARFGGTLSYVAKTLPTKGTLRRKDTNALIVANVAVPTNLWTYLPNASGAATDPFTWVARETLTQAIGDSMTATQTVVTHAPTTPPPPPPPTPPPTRGGIFQLSQFPKFGPGQGVDWHVVLYDYYPTVEQTSFWDTALWDQATWEGSAKPVDIARDVQSISITQERDTPTGRFGPGTCTINVDDLDGSLSPWRQLPSEGGVAQGLRPGIKVGVIADWNGQSWSRFYGTVQSITEGFPNPLSGRHTVNINAVDALSLLAAYDGVEQAPIGEGETAGSRIRRILDIVDLEELTAIDDGATPLQATTLDGNALDLAGAAVDTELGAFFVDRLGVLRFVDWGSLTTNNPIYTEPQYIFGDASGELCYADIELVTNKDQVRNVITIANKDGTPVTLVDANSIAAYGQRTYQRTDLIHLDPDRSDTIAARYLSLYADAARRIESLTILPSVNPETIQAALDIDVLYRVTVRRRAEGFSVAADLQVQGVTHEITPTEWTVTYKTFSAATMFRSAAWDTSRWDDPAAVWGY